MKKISAKNKIYILASAWILGSFFMFAYGFKILHTQNLRTLDKIDSQKRELAVLEVERKSYEQAKNDIEMLSKKSMQPGNFFSRDITLVKEIQILEKLGTNLGVEYVLAGISGTIASASKAKALSSDIVVLPFSISLSGTLNQTMEYLEALENLPFALNINGIGISAGTDGKVNMNLTSNFYIKK